MQSRISIPNGVSATSGVAVGATRFVIASQATVVPRRSANRSAAVQTGKWGRASRAAWNNSKMSPSRSAMWTHGIGSPRCRVGTIRFANRRNLSFFSIGTRVVLTVRSRALLPLNATGSRT